VPLASRLTEEELGAHRAFIAGMGEKALWNEFQPAAAPAETVAPAMPPRESATAQAVAPG